MRLLIIIAIVGCLAGCGSGKNTPTRQLTTTVKDSTVTEVRFEKRDTLITIPGDTLKFRIPFHEITREGKSHTQGNQTVNISKDDLGNISVDCINASIDLLLELQDRFEETLRILESSSQEVIEVPVEFTPWYKNILAWIGGIVLAAGTLLLAIKLIKPF